MDDKIISDYFEKRIGFTDNPHEAMFILRDGQLVSGGFFGGIRGEDHRIAEGLIDLDRYDKDFWSKLHYETGIVQLVPETATALIMEGQKINLLQESVIESIGYKIEECCPAYNLNLESRRVAEDESWQVREMVKDNPNYVAITTQNLTGGIAGAKERATAKLKEKQASNKEVARDTRKNEIDR